MRLVLETKARAVIALFATTGLFSQEPTYFGRLGHPIDAVYKAGDLHHVALFEFPLKTPIAGNQIIDKFMQSGGLRGFTFSGSPVKVIVSKAQEPMGYEEPFFVTTVVHPDGRMVEQEDVFYWTSNLDVKFIKIDKIRLNTSILNHFQLSARAEAKKSILGTKESLKHSRPRLSGPVRIKAIGSPKGHPNMALVSFTYKVIGIPKDYNPFNERWDEFVRIDYLIDVSRKQVIYMNREGSGSRNDGGRFLFLEIDKNRLFMVNATSCFDGVETILVDITNGEPVDSGSLVFTCW